MVLRAPNNFLQTFTVLMKFHIFFNIILRFSKIRADRLIDRQRDIENLGIQNIVLTKDILAFLYLIMFLHSAD